MVAYYRTSAITAKRNEQYNVFHDKGLHYIYWNWAGILLNIY